MNIIEWRNGSGHYKPLADDTNGKAETIKLFQDYIGKDITNLFKPK